MSLLVDKGVFALDLVCVFIFLVFAGEYLCTLVYVCDSFNLLCCIIWDVCMCLRFCV